MSREVATHDARGKERFQTVNDLPSETIQSQAQQGDINHILKKYDQVGVIGMLNNAEQVWRDVTSFDDYADAIRHAKDAEMEFMKLPSKVREVFNHDVANWLDAAHDPEKRQNVLEKLGLVDSAQNSDTPRGTQDAAASSAGSSAAGGSPEGAGSSE